MKDALKSASEPSRGKLQRRLARKSKRQGSSAPTRERGQTGELGEFEARPWFSKRSVEGKRLSNLSPTMNLKKKSSLLAADWGLIEAKCSVCDARYRVVVALLWCNQDALFFVLSMYPETVKILTTHILWRMHDWSFHCSCLFNCVYLFFNFLEPSFLSRRFGKAVKVPIKGGPGKAVLRVDRVS